MPNTVKVKTYLYHARISVMQDEGLDVGDNGREVEGLVSVSQADYLMSRLTRRQREVVELLQLGYTRREVAQRLGVCLQAIHQIVPRMRKRLAGWEGNGATA
jgi:DNA-directed RNA polymerase specialized sigma24 family protein